MNKYKYMFLLICRLERDIRHTVLDQDKTLVPGWENTTIRGVREMKIGFISEVNIGTVERVMDTWMVGCS